MRRSLSSNRIVKTAGALRAAWPGFIAPCLATARDAVPTRGAWVYEIKYDGYRSQLHLRDGTARVFTRRGYDWSATFRAIAESATRLGARSAIIDGEVVVLDDRGVPDFHALQDALARDASEQFTYFAFDLLYLDGFDVRRAPLVERKRLLASVLGKTPPGARIRFSEHLDVDPQAMLDRACAMQLEGIIAKRPDAPYRSGRQETWLKLKCHRSETFPIVAFVEKLGAKPRRIASLYLGRWDEQGRLLYAGKAQSGFRHRALYELREKLDPYIRPTSPLAVPVKKPKATWVEPVVLAEVQFASMSAANVLRAPVYKGIREDLAPEPAPAALPRRLSKPRVPKENILQWLPDAVAPTKEALAAYWKGVAKRALAHLARRPLKLVRHTHETTFYHKGPLPPVPRAVHQLAVARREGGIGTRLWVDDLAGLLGLVEIGAVELHPWNSTIDDLEHPDVLVFDLDPGAGVEWAFVVDTALTLRDMLRSEGWKPWPKLTGGKGLHLMVPLGSSARLTHDEAHAYSRAIAARVEATAPRRYTLSAATVRREGRLFIDYLRNGRGTTAIGAWSPRARAGFPIAAPTTWPAVEGGITPDAFSMSRPTTRRRPAPRSRRPER